MQPKLQQLVPVINDFEQDRANTKFLEQKHGHSINPYPILLNKSFSNEIKQAHDILVKALHALVAAYFLDEDIQAIIKIPENIHMLLEKTKGLPFTIHTMRPDFLITQDNAIKICEINARSPMNGFLSACELAEVVNSDQSFEYKTHPKSQTILNNLLDLFDLKKPVFLIREQEAGYDINFYEEEIKGRSLISQTVITVKPSDLALKEGKVEAHGIQCDQFMFESGQQELLSIPVDVLEVIQRSVCVNDLRTLFICHDKRALAVLSNKSIMSKYMSDKDVDLLLEYMIPTYLVNDDVKQAIRSDKDKWIFKKFLAGKGKDMYIGKDHDLESINTGLVHAKDYIAQPYIEQNKLDLTVSDNQQERLFLVGMIVSIQEQYNGPGFFRASLEKITNLSSSKSWVLKIVEQN